LACKNVVRWQAVQAFKVSVCIVVVDEGVELPFQVIWQEIVVEQDEM
jgi:hypothetical protein